jgi:S-DNA-T family DNA segregation ATPase FtsK/SpoIIIE
VERKKHEILAICVLVITLLVFFSLVSFRSDDLSVFNASSVARSPRNWVGFLGANLSWCLLFLLGIGAYGLPITGLWFSWSLFRGGWPASFGWLRILGAALFILSFVGLAALHQPRMRIMGQEILTGGQVGFLVAVFLESRVYTVGAHIVLIGALLIAFVLATPFTLSSCSTQACDLVLSALRALLGSVMSLGKLFRRSPKENETEAVEPEKPRRVKAKALPPTVEVLTPSVPRPKRALKEIAAPAVDLESEMQCRYTLPSLDLMDSYESELRSPDLKKLEENARVLEEKLADFGVSGKVVAVRPGPVITMYEYAPAPGIKISRIVGLSDDLSMALKAISIRVVAPIPGKGAIGIELPNDHRAMVSLRTVLESEAFSASPAPLTIALGNDTTGQPVVANLAKMPHLLIAGATGTGKSVCINAVLSSLLYRNTPDEMRLLLIDPKRIELSSYEGIPHLIHPVVTDAKMATLALRWAVHEMELRYKLLADKNVRNIESYNKAILREKPKKDKPEASRPPQPSQPEEPELEHHHLPFIVIIIDELADLMMVASREVEESITRLAQMARAAGIHLILATQRPSVDVLTGIIKANIPTRLSFQVSSRIDSRTILDGSGAESLLGSGDMLFLPPGTAKLQRIHGAFVSDNEVERLTKLWKAQQLADDPLKARVIFEDNSSSDQIDEADLDEKYDEAVELVLETRQASISMLQRRLRVGYNRAARMIEMMEQQGIVGSSDGIKPREVLGRAAS